MSRVLSSSAPAREDDSAGVVVRPIRDRLLTFITWPLGIVLAMRPQRERQAARIAAEFHRSGYVGKPDV
jgi:hypothetical protein